VKTASPRGNGFRRTAHHFGNLVVIVDLIIHAQLVARIERSEMRDGRSRIRCAIRATD
jgi:hypothetical protein